MTGQGRDTRAAETGLGESHETLPITLARKMTGPTACRQRPLEHHFLSRYEGAAPPPPAPPKSKKEAWWWLTPEEFDWHYQTLCTAAGFSVPSPLPFSHERRWLRALGDKGFSKEFLLGRIIGDCHDGGGVKTKRDCLPTLIECSV
ncbi:hypothetical protein ASPZODRAFT_1579219 [Penicilliopsis zonata CBS 506.65]|uniref:Uncharacterized protein n=1 Tax=Penicilliopsis zonata CBS 506.65 TaxID=1073090 RepID=A0A1L9SMN9_9EURO|nr:hypothetical protein ASPZODRAFT_1579219 [Penicilliopsis zonata CBS 506.65]OJJ48376.1 hypothetical protein ASPZODRAFT_1579219 [Penicilliopsis zonata CBS 506.65]